MSRQLAFVYFLLYSPMYRERGMSIKVSHSLPASVTISSHQESSFECALREAPLLLLFSNTVTCVG